MRIGIAAFLIVVGAALDSLAEVRGVDLGAVGAAAGESRIGRL